MLIKIKTYHDTFFSPEVIREAVLETEKVANSTPSILIDHINKVSCSVTKDFVSWSYDNFEEFIPAYIDAPWGAKYTRSIGLFRLEVSYNINENSTVVSVEGINKQSIETVFNVFEKYLSVSKKPRELAKREMKVFIGHGGSGQWRELKDHLHDKHDYEIEAYEIGSRAGHTIRDILEEMLTKSSIAFLVMTGEDEDKSGKMHPRDNVIHELGLFQGRLGFAKAIVLLEDGTNEFSNIAGIHQIRYSKNNIKEVFGDVISVINREFKTS